jgi:hypothetical protein
MARIAVLLVIVAAITTGCGAADEAGQTANTGGATGTRGELFGDDDSISGQTAAFRAGVVYCNLYPIDVLAQQEGVEATPEAVARSYSKAEATPKDQEQAYKGCLSVLKKPPQ